MTEHALIDLNEVAASLKHCLNTLLELLEHDLVFRVVDHIVGPPPASVPAQLLELYLVLFINLAQSVDGQRWIETPRSVQEDDALLQAHVSQVVEQALLNQLLLQVQLLLLVDYDFILLLRQLQRLLDLVVGEASQSRNVRYRHLRLRLRKIIYILAEPKGGD